MKRKRTTRSGMRAVIAGLAVVVALFVASVPVASAHQGHSGAPGKPAAANQDGKPGSGKKGIRKSGHVKPGHGGHAAAPRR